MKDNNNPAVKSLTTIPAEKIQINEQVIVAQTVFAVGGGS